MTISEPLFIILITSISGIIMKLISMFYKSKCKKVDCCCIHIERDIIIEEEYDEKELKEFNKNDSTKI
jgi:hypothetical protein